MSARIAVIGGGIMGRGIARALAAEGAVVSVVEPSERVADELRALGITVADLASALAECDLVIEAAPENLELKLDIWRRIDELAPEGAILATNTSSFDIDELATAVADPARFLGLHWFHPATVIPCVEVVSGTATSTEAVETATALMSEFGKWPIRVRTSPGFIANRLQFALFREAVLCWEEGLASAEEIDDIVRASFGPRLGMLGPLMSADLGGLDTYLSILGYLDTHLGERFSPPAALAAMVAEGRLGAKSGDGIRGLAPEEYAAAAAELASSLPAAYSRPKPRE